jgi:hypothetical protein
MKPCWLSLSLTLFDSNSGWLYCAPDSKGMLLASFHSKLKTMDTKRSNSTNPREHTSRIKSEMKDLIDHLRDDVSKVDDDKAKALFETSAEVIAGLQKAFTDYEEKNETAWKD